MLHLNGKSIFTLSLAFIFMCFEFLFSSYMLPNEKPIILSVVGANFLLYLFFFIKSEIKSTNKTFYTVLYFFLSAVACSVFVKYIWFSNHLCLDPFHKLFNGDFNADTLSHSAITESIISNGYPSLLFETKDIFYYHFGSHYLMAAISKLLNIHAFSAYNYIFPPIFIPLFFLLLFTSIEKVANRKISFIEVLFIVTMGFIGFIPKSFESNLGFWMGSFFASESFCIGLTLLFLFIILIDKKNTLSVKNLIFTFIFIIVCASMKISIGILLWCFFNWYAYRSKGIIKTIPYTLITTISLSIAFFLFNERIGSASAHQIMPLHFYKNYITIDALMYHLLLFTWPIVIPITFKFSDRKIITAIKAKNALLEESLIITTLISILPGAILYIEGGSAFYFFAVLYPLFIIYFIASNFFGKLIIQKKSLLLAIPFFAVIIGTVSLNTLSSISSIYKNLPSLKSGIISLENNALFVAIEEIRTKTKANRKNTAIIIEKSSKLFEIYNGKDLRSLSYFLQSYTGLPVYGMYEQKDEDIFLITGDFIQPNIKPLYFGLDYNKVFSGKSIEEKMKIAGISQIIYLSN